MNVIETEKLTRIFGKTEAVKDLDLSIPEGAIFAFLGPNGAGKTTTIKILMNMLEATSGVARVLGVETRRLQPEHFSKIGYVSENQEIPKWMTVASFLDYCRPFYPGWDQDFEKRLLREFDLPSDQKIKDLSRGMQMKVSLLSSLAYRPKLLVLDEPFSGLDPLVRDEFIRGILELSEQEGWSMMISSHDIDEVERLANRVGILHKGRLLALESTEELQGRFREVEVELAGETGLPAPLPPTWMCVERAGGRLRFTESRFTPEDYEARLAALLPGGRKTGMRSLTLREIFLNYARTYRIS